MQESLLVELRTEELPPKSLTRLADAFGQAVFEGLANEALTDPNSRLEVFATPRRLALRVSHVLDRQPDRTLERRGPAVASGLDAEGKPTRALEGFARSVNLPIHELGRTVEGKNEYFSARIARPGEALAAVLPGVLTAALKKLPIARLMRWGDRDDQFVRPVHGLIVLHGEAIVAVSLLGCSASRQTLGHRFLSERPVEVSHADQYETALEEQGRVIVSVARRRAMIVAGLQRLEQQLEARLVSEHWSAVNFPAADAGQAERAAESLGDGALLDEVTALVEYPAVYAGRFDADFLAVPIECLTLTMKQNQKYFPAAGPDGRLKPAFAVVSNLVTADPSAIIGGNERVLRARLSDARFFFEQDLKNPLASHVAALDTVVYHNKLGSQLQRVGRIRALARGIAGQLGADPHLADRAAELCKADLLTGMVGEFPELQGVMGQYYALHDGETAEVANAIAGHYHPRFAGDSLPPDAISAAVALADKLDGIAGIWGIGLIPTGDKDPFGLRRQALGILRMLAEQALPLNVRELIAAALKPFDFADAGLADAIYGFMLDRLRTLLKEMGAQADEVEAIVGQQPEVLSTIIARLKALQAFRLQPEAISLAAANKRIQNILRSEGARGIDLDQNVNGSLDAPEATALAATLEQLRPQVDQLFAAQDFTAALAALASLRAPVDAFFDNVMVMADDPQVRANRLRLLAQLATLMNRVADISRLAT